MFKLFRRKKSDENTTRLFDINKENQNITVKVLSQHNSLLFIGKMKRMANGDIELTNNNDENTPFIVYNTIVKIVDTHEDSFSLLGKVIASTDKLWRVSDIKVLSKKNIRKNNRESINMSGTLDCKVGEIIREDKCRVLDISIGGAKIESKRKMNEKDRFILDITYRGTRLLLTCNIRRVQTTETGYEYGCQFEHLTNQTLDRLNKMVFEIERAKIMTL